MKRSNFEFIELALMSFLETDVFKKESQVLSASTQN